MKQKINWSVCIFNHHHQQQQDFPIKDILKRQWETHVKMFSDGISQILRIQQYTCGFLLFSQHCEVALVLFSTIPILTMRKHILGVHISFLKMHSK